VPSENLITKTRMLDIVLKLLLIRLSDEGMTSRIKREGEARGGREQKSRSDFFRGVGKIPSGADETVPFSATAGQDYKKKSRFLMNRSKWVKHLSTKKGKKRRGNVTQVALGGKQHY